MKRTALFLTVGATVAVVCLTTSTAAVGARPLNTASGGGSIEQAGVPMESYGFQAQIDVDGYVRGRGVWQYRPQEARFHGEFTCLHVNGNDAWLGGELTKVDVEGFPPLPIYFVWSVRDNGQGAAADNDQVSVMLLSLNPDFPDTCTLEPLLPLLELTNGNVQVR